MSAVHTVLLDFSIDNSRISSSDGREKVLDGILQVIDTKNQLLAGLTRDKGLFIAPNVFVAVAKEILVTIRFEDSQGLITVNFEYLHKEGNDQPVFSYEVLESLFISPRIIELARERISHKLERNS